MDDKKLQVLVNDANNVMDWLVKFLDDNKGLYEDRTLNYDRVLENKDRLMREFNIKNDRTFNKYFKEFKEDMNFLFESYMEDCAIEDIREYGKNKTFNLRNNIISMYKGEVDVAVTVLFTYKKEQSFMNCFIENNKLVDVDRAKELIADMKERYGDYINVSLDTFIDDVQYVLNDFMDDFKDRMWDAIEINEYLKDLEEVEVEFFENHLQTKRMPAYHTKYPRFY